MVAYAFNPSAWPRQGKSLWLKASLVYIAFKASQSYIDMVSMR